jgi:Tol biopolymer transport system component
VSAPTNRNSAALSVAGGLLAFGGGSTPRRLAWFDRRGDRLSTIQTPTALHSPVFSSDGKRLLAQSFEADNSGVWMLDLERDTTDRIVPDGSMPMLSPDGATLVFGSYRGTGVFDLFARRVTGKNEDMPLLHTNENKFVNDWTRDGRYILFASSNAKTGEDMWLLPTFGDRQPIPYLRSEFNEIQSRASPDGRWVAYSSNESGAWEVYVQSFPIAGAKQVISVRGGAEPVWRSDGHELYYLAADRTLMAVEITSSGDTLKIGRPVALFRPPVSGSLNVFRSHYAVTPDGKRFVIDTFDSESAQESITVISNWTALLGR